MATSVGDSEAAGRRNSVERVLWRACPPQAGWWTSVAPASETNSRSIAPTATDPANAGTAAVSSAPANGAPGSARTAALA